MTFAVLAEGSDRLSYTWTKDGASIEDPSLKSTSSTFTIDSFLPGDHKGHYQCIVSGESDDDGIVEVEKSKIAELKGTGSSCSL